MPTKEQWKLRDSQMIKVRKADKRGHENYGWLDTRHTFSFASFHDPDYMGFRTLRVINEDRVAPGKGFSPHKHKNMEIISYILEGALEHKDSMGNKGVIRKGELQRISAGTGIQHSEYNHSNEDPVHFYQIWLLPEKDDISPSYEQLNLNISHGDTPFQLVASPTGENNTLTINQNSNLYLGNLKPNTITDFILPKGRYGWVQVIEGAVSLNNLPLVSGDGAAISEESKLTFNTESKTKVLLFDLP